MGDRGTEGRGGGGVGSVGKGRGCLGPCWSCTCIHWVLGRHIIGGMFVLYVDPTLTVVYRSDLGWLWVVYYRS